MKKKPDYQSMWGLIKIVSILKQDAIDYAKLHLRHNEIGLKFMFTCKICNKD